VYRNAAVANQQSAIGVQRDLLRRHDDGRRLLCRAQRYGREKGNTGNDAEEPPHAAGFASTGSAALRHRSG
jgi:hypothetical protein